MMMDTVRALLYSIMLLIDDSNNVIHDILYTYNIPKNSSYISYHSMPLLLKYIYAAAEIYNIARRHGGIISIVSTCV